MSPAPPAQTTVRSLVTMNEGQRIHQHQRAEAVVGIGTVHDWPGSVVVYVWLH